MDPGDVNYNDAEVEEVRDNINQIHARLEFVFHWHVMDDEER